MALWPVCGTLPKSVCLTRQTVRQTNCLSRCRLKTLIIIIIHITVLPQTLPLFSSFFLGRLFQSAVLLLSPGARLPFYFVVVVKLLAWEDWTVFAVEEINFLSPLYDQHVRAISWIIAVWSWKWLLIQDYKGDGGSRKKITRPPSWTQHCGYGEAIAGWCHRAICPPALSSPRDVRKWVPEWCFGMSEMVATEIIFCLGHLDSFQSTFKWANEKFRGSVPEAWCWLVCVSES